MKLLHRLLVVILILSCFEYKLFGQDVNDSSGNYRFYSDNTASQSETGSEKKKPFLSSFDTWSRKKKAVVFNEVAVGTTLVIGAGTWDYFSSSFDFLNEGWLGYDTNYGGSDKFGHAFGGYALTSVYKSVYKSFGYSDNQSILYGAISSWALLTLVEVGDGFSQEYGFSMQDEAFNTAGVLLGYIRQRYPVLKDMFDYRLEWVPSDDFKNGNADPFTDYSGQKNILALKPAGILKSDNSLLKAIDLDIGFYTRGYEDNFHTKRRYIFYGVGLNVTYVLEQLTGHKLGGIFDYIQVPFTYIPFKSKLD